MRLKQHVHAFSAPEPIAVRPGAGAGVQFVNGFTNLVPLTELTNRYKGEDGGLYGGGRNQPPTAHWTAYLKESAGVRPLGAAGEPSADGKIGLVIIGFSNTMLEAEDFKRTGAAAKIPGPHSKAACARPD